MFICKMGHNSSFMKICLQVTTPQVAVEQDIDSGFSQTSARNFFWCDARRRVRRVNLAKQGHEGAGLRTLRCHSRVPRLKEAHAHIQQFLEVAHVRESITSVRRVLFVREMSCPFLGGLGLQRGIQIRVLASTWHATWCAEIKRIYYIQCLLNFCGCVSNEQNHHQTMGIPLRALLL